MKILAMDTSAKVTSVCVVDENGVIAEFNSNNKLTHSQALMPMLDSLLTCAQLSLDDIDGFACSVGPGSFTGLRIGISAIKGLSFASNKPCVGVSSLESLALNLLGFDGIICAVMDARCNQVYTATFIGDGNTITRISEDCAITIDQLYSELSIYDKNIFFVGDGADLCYNKLKDSLSSVFIVSDLLKYQKAVSVGFCGLKKLESGYSVSCDELMPIYLRLPQAERELLKKKEGEKNR